MRYHHRGIRPHQSALSIVFRASDAALIFLVLTASTLVYGTPWSDDYAVIALIAIVLFMLFAESLQIYRAWELPPIVYAWLSAVFGLLVTGYVTKTTDDFSRLTLGVWMMGTPLALIGWRVLVRKTLHFLRARGYIIRTVAIGGANEQGYKLAGRIQANPALGLRLIGFFDDRSPEGFSLDEKDGRIIKNLPAPLVGTFKDMVECAKSGEIEVIYIVLSLRGQERIAELIHSLSDTTASVYLVPDFFVFDLLHSRWVNIGNIPTISVFESPFSFYGVEGFAKRLEDIILSTLILMLLTIPMLLIAIGVKYSSPGPVLFKQTRYGLDGRKIKVWKFRSMTVCEDGPNIPQAQRGDSRITPFGAFLRRTSLDELPQFFNVLTGQMSIVGPRPHAVAHNEEYRKLISGYMLRHKVKPGITGWAQINGWRGETDTIEKMQKRVEYDLWYIRNWSLWIDLKIIFLTAFKEFRGQNAY